jgi:DNA-binding CsgD family transcriptional regulator
LDIRAQAELDLIGAIYDAVIDPGRWNDTVDRIRRHAGFHLAILAVSALPSGKFIIGGQSNVPSPYSETITSFGTEPLDLWGGVERIVSFPREEPLIHTEFNAQDSWIGNRYYEEWARPQHLVNQVALVLEYNPRMLASISFGVHETNPVVTDAQVETLRVLAPHLRRAAIISGLLDGRTRAAASFEATLSELGSGVVLVDADMRIVYANQRAEAMLMAGDPVTRLAGHLDLPRELVRGQLRAAVAAAATSGAGLQRGSGIPARRRDGGEIVVHVLPLRHPASARGIAATAAVFVAETDGALNIPMEALQLLYGLRPAESRVLQLVVAGYSGARIAATLGIASSTVKTHTQRLFDKVGVHSRVELARVARDLSLGAG